MTTIALCRSLRSVLTAGIVLIFGAWLPADEPKPAVETSKSGREVVVKALHPISVLVGDWKGVGQPRRGSNAGAWSEKVLAGWQFGEVTQLALKFESGKLYSQAIFGLADDGKTPQLMLLKTDGDQLILSVTSAEESASERFVSWSFASSAENETQVRATIRIISDIRATLLFEERNGGKGSYRRIAEIGMTRAGERLALANAGEHQCIVTGGLGIIKVTHEGKTYYVCCEGCKQAFDADPAGTVESYRERLKEALDRKVK